MSTIIEDKANLRAKLFLLDDLISRLPDTTPVALKNGRLDQLFKRGTRLSFNPTAVDDDSDTEGVVVDEHVIAMLRPSDPHDPKEFHADFWQTGKFGLDGLSKYLLDLSVNHEACTWRFGAAADSLIEGVKLFLYAHSNFFPFLC